MYKSLHKSINLYERTIIHNEQYKFSIEHRNSGQRIRLRLDYFTFSGEYRPIINVNFSQVR